MAHEMTAGVPGASEKIVSRHTGPSGITPTGGSGRSGSTTATTNVGFSANDIANRLSALYSAYSSQRQADLNAAYDRARSSLNEGYDTAAGALQGNLDASKNAINSSYNNSLKGLQTDAEKSLREAYLNKVMSEKNMQQKMSAMGMNGGATESSLAKLYNNYGNSRNNINTTLNSNIGDLSASRDQSLAEAYNTYNNNLANLASQKASALANLEMALASGMGDVLDQQYSFQMNGMNDKVSSLINALNNYKGVATSATNGATPITVNQTNAGDVSSASNYAEYIQFLKNLGLVF